MNGISNHSDRGYTSYETIFEFLNPAGCEFTNTIKRQFPNPFIWGATKERQNDPRTKLDEKGCASVHLKSIMKNGRTISVHAFRTGTKNISSVISSTIHGHAWEATALNPKQRIKWEKDSDKGLKEYYFQKLSSCNELFSDYEFEIERLFDEFIEERIDVLTLTQGTVDWHQGRQFSFTSFQADSSITKAIIVYQDDDDWCAIGEHLEGCNYRQGKK